jgi:hypothetical protein
MQKFLCFLLSIAHRAGVTVFPTLLSNMMHLWLCCAVPNEDRLDLHIPGIPGDCATVGVARTDFVRPSRREHRAGDVGLEE